MKLEATECKNPLLKKAFLFSCRTGIAFTDTKNLEWQDFKIDHEGKYYIAFHRQKTKGLQYLPITNETLEMLGTAGKPDEKIFGKLKQGSWTNIILREWIFKAGIQKNITFHNARHTNATLLIHKGAKIETVNKLLGHKDLKTTMGYVKVMDKDLRKSAELINFSKNQTND